MAATVAQDESSPQWDACAALSQEAMEQAVKHGTRVIEAVAEGRGLQGGEIMLPKFELMEGGRIVKCAAGSGTRISFFDAHAVDSSSASASDAASPETVWHKTVGAEFRNTEALRRACSLLPANDLEVPFCGCFDYMGRRCAVTCDSDVDGQGARGIRGQTSSSLHYIFNDILGLPPAAVDVVSDYRAGKSRVIKARQNEPSVQTC
jgi:hypothetical protein